MSATAIEDLIQFAMDRGISIPSVGEINREASSNVLNYFDYSVEQIKENFDNLLEQTEKEAYGIYQKHEKEFGRKVIEKFIEHLIKNGEIGSFKNIGTVIGEYFNVFDKFFLSLTQSRRVRAGKTFESIHNSLFKKLNYPFAEQIVINGKPDFVMPSEEHYERNPMDCIIFTAKRTLRERWRQITTEGARGLGFYLATIDTKVSSNQLQEMLRHRIYLVCPESVKNQHYSDSINVLSFRQFFKDHLDPKLETWKRNKVI